jgi:GNAT superfamily N-acetyltransferase
VSYKVRRTTDLDMVRALDLATFPNDERVATDSAAWWILTCEGKPVGFAGARLANGMAYLCRAGVLPEHRGKGLQRRLIRARVRWAMASDAFACYTYTVTTNHRSANNLIRCGFLLYEPNARWAGESLYFWKRLG